MSRDQPQLLVVSHFLNRLEILRRRRYPLCDRSSPESQTKLNATFRMPSVPTCPSRWRRALHMNSMTDRHSEVDSNPVALTSTAGARADSAFDASRTRTLLAVLSEHGMLYQSLKLSDYGEHWGLAPGVAMHLSVMNWVTGKWVRVANTAGRVVSNLPDWYQYIREELRYDGVVLLELARPAN